MNGITESLCLSVYGYLQCLCLYSDSQTMTQIISFISSFLTHTPFFSHTGEFLDIDLLSSEVTSVLRGRRWTVRPLLWVYCLLAKHTNTHTKSHTQGQLTAVQLQEGGLAGRCTHLLERAVLC